MAIISFDLEAGITRVQAAACPEDLFGDVADDAKRNYRDLARWLHPDHWIDEGDKQAANNIFPDLQGWWKAAQGKIAAGTYGNRFVSAPKNPEPVSSIVLTKGKNTYTIGNLIEKDFFSNIYQCSVTSPDGEQRAVFRVSRNESDNDLMQRESDALRHFDKTITDPRFLPYRSHLIDSFLYKDSDTSVRRRANIISTEVDGMYTLQQVRERYPNGLDPRDMAWMWRRLLVALGFSEMGGIVHGAILPPNVLIHPEKHGLTVTNWYCATKEKEFIPLMLEGYEDWYPNEVKEKKPVHASIDLAMGARTMIYLMNGNPVTGSLPSLVPIRYQRFFKACLNTSIMGINNLWKVLESFDKILEETYGPRKFRPFTM